MKVKIIRIHRGDAYSLTSSDIIGLKGNFKIDKVSYTPTYEKYYEGYLAGTFTTKTRTREFIAVKVEQCK